MARWYIIHAYSGFENKVRDSILTEAERLGLSDGVEQVEVPTETVTEVKRGKKVQSERKFMPGYVLAKLNLTDDVYHLVKNTPKVTGFLGAGNKPQAISEKDAARYFGGVAEAQAAPKKDVSVDYDIGDQVKVLEGPFASFNGLVEELDFDKTKVRSASRSSAARRRWSSISSRWSWSARGFGTYSVRATARTGIPRDRTSRTRFPCTPFVLRSHRA